MSNSLTPMSPTYWSRIMGKKLYKSTVYRALASFEEQKTLSDGQIVDRPYRSDLVAETYTKGTALTAQDLTATSDQLTVNQNKGLLMYIDNVDKVQNKWDAAKIWAEEAATRLSVLIDAAFLYEVVNANNVVDNGDLGGTDGDPIPVTTSNILKIFGLINRRLNENDVPLDDRYFVFGPQFNDVLWQFIAGKESLLGDKTGEYGNIGKYAGLKLFVSNNLTASAVWTPANNPSNTNTITIAGVTLTLVSSIGSTAGNVLIGSTTEDTLGNIADLINAGGVGDGVNSVSLSAANQRTMQKFVAVDTATTLTVYGKGSSYLTVSGSDATDTWTLETQQCMAGRKGAVDMVIQKEPDVEMASTVSAGKRGLNVMPLTIFGVKTFNQGKNELVRVAVDTSSFA